MSNKKQEETSGVDVLVESAKTDMKKEVQKEIKTIEHELGLKLQRNMNVLQVVGGIMVTVLIPIFWFGIQGIVSAKVDEQAKQIDSRQKSTLQTITQLQDNIKLDTLFLAITNRLIISKLEGLSYQDAQSLLDNLIQLKEDNSRGSIERSLLISDIEKFSLLLINNNYMNLFYRLEEHFSQVIERSPNIQSAALSLYGNQILSNVAVDEIKTKPVYHHFNRTVSALNAQNREDLSLGLRALVRYHLENDQKNKLSTQLIESVQVLSPRAISQVLLNIFSYSDSKLISTNDIRSSHERTSIVVQKFLYDYRIELTTIGDQEGVKGELIRLYENSSNYTTERAARYMLRWFYEMEV